MNFNLANKPLLFLSPISFSILPQKLPCPRYQQVTGMGLSHATIFVFTMYKGKIFAYQNHNIDNRYLLNTCQLSYIFKQSIHLNYFAVI